MDDPRGRVDLLLLRLGEAICGRIQAHTGVDLWEGSPALNQTGLKQLTNEFIDQCGVPRAPIDIPRTLVLALTGKSEEKPPQLQAKPAASNWGSTRPHAAHGRVRRSRRDYV
jgi:hypothetical protein